MVDWSSVVIILLGSGGVASLVGSVLGYWLDKKAKERAEIIEMAKFRMEKISDRIPDYVILMNLCQWLSVSLRRICDNNSISSDRAFMLTMFWFYVSLLQKSRNVFLFRGGLLLADQDAESVIAGLYNMFKQEMDAFNFLDGSKVRQLINEDDPPSVLERVIKHECEPNHTEANGYFETFVNWVCYHGNRSKIEHVADVLQCMHELIMFETNYTFEKWYNKRITAAGQLGKETLNLLYEKPLLGSIKGEKKTLRESKPGYFRKIFIDRRS